MKYRIAICDDEQAQAGYLKSSVSEWSAANGGSCVIKTFPSAEAFLFEYSEDKTYDILLLDIEMKEMNGIELAKRVRAGNSTVQIIFITGYPDFISEGYEVSALHYLMKPVSKEKLAEVLDRAVKNLVKDKRALVFDTKNGKIKLFSDDILYTEVFAHYIVIHTVDGEHVCRITLEAFLSEAGEASFIRVHRSFAVNLNSVSRITKTEIILDNGESVPLSRRLYNDIYSAFIAYYGRG